VSFKQFDPHRLVLPEKNIHDSPHRVLLPHTPPFRAPAGRGAPEILQRHPHLFPTRVSSA
jgi:hypothetical protein